MPRRPGLGHGGWPGHAPGGYQVRGIDKHTIDRRLRAALPLSTYDHAKGALYRARTLVGRNPGRGRLLPDFLVIGSTKCGTTSLHGWLTQHPFVAETKKEIHFFNMNYYRSVDWYRCYFPYARDRDAFAREQGRPFLVGEATASYLAHYWTPQRAHRLVPDARLIVSLRDPVDRAYSQYHYFRRRGSEPLATFEAAVEAEEERLRGEEEHEVADRHYHSWRVFRWGYKRTSRYAEHLERWLELFPREQFLFLNFDTELATEPDATLARVHEFLGLPPHSSGPLPTLNAGTYDALSSDTRERLNDYFRPHNRRVFELTGIDFGWAS
jgi:hypothetical protein